VAGRPRGTYALSDWEIDELAYHARAGWTQKELASYYRVSTKTVGRVMQRLETMRADLSPSKGKTE
jgi:transposase